jgi:type I restriction enzyme S subunit
MNEMVVPDGWKKTSLGAETVFIKDGTHGTHIRHSSGIPLLSAKNISPYGKLIWGDKDSRISELDYQKIHSKYQIQIGDVLITVVGTLGRTTVDIKHNTNLDLIF